MAERIVVIIQARLRSTRLPGKTLTDLAGRPVLAHVVERAKAIPGVDDLVLAIAEGDENQPIVDFAQAAGLQSERGSESDVLGRTYRTACRFQADAVVRISPDCPLLDPKVSGLVVAEYRRRVGEVDYVSNIDPPSFPDGLDTEVFPHKALERANKEARLGSDREHVTTFIRREFARSRQYNVLHSPDLSGLRWTVDTADDLSFVKQVHAHLNPNGNRLFEMEEILELLRQHPELAKLNAGIHRNEGLARSLAADAERAAR